MKAKAIGKYFECKCFSNSFAVVLLDDEFYLQCMACKAIYDVSEVLEELMNDASKP